MLDDAAFAGWLVPAGPGLVVFDAAWCGPCRQLIGELDVVGEGLGHRLRMARADVDAAPRAAVAAFAAVLAPGPDGKPMVNGRGVPLLVLYRDGAPVAARLGAAPRAALRGWIETALAVPANRKDG